MSQKGTGILKIGSQNIQGAITKKLDFSDVDSIIREHDIFCFQETWLICSKIMSVQGYQILRSDRGKFKKKNTGLGGVCIIYRSELKKGIKKITIKNKDYLWARLDEKSFGLKNDIYLCNAYIPPENSELHKQPDIDYFDTKLQNK